MAITGIPNYSGALPIEYSLRCPCGLRYLVFTGMGRTVGDAESRAQARAASMGARFIDSRSIPFMNCSCGQVLDFTSEESLAVM